MARTMNVIERSRWLAANRMTDVPSWIQQAFRQMRTTQCVRVVEELAPVAVRDGRMIVLGGKTRVGKTTAGYYAFAVIRSHAIESRLLVERDRWRDYNENIRPQILSEGEPQADIPAREDGEDEDTFRKRVSAAEVMARVAATRYRAAMQGRPEPEWATLEDEELRAEVPTNVWRAADIINMAWDNRGWLDKFRKAGDLLVVDDIGTEHMTDRGYQLSLWDEFFDYRHRHMLPTIITTNLSTAQFAERYTHPEHGPRIPERVKEQSLKYHWQNERE